MSDIDEKVRAEREEEARFLEVGKKRDRIAKANSDFFLAMFLESAKDGPVWDPAEDFDPLYDQMTAEEKEVLEASWQLSRRKLANVFHRHRYEELYAWRLAIHRERQANKKAKTKQDADRTKASGWKLNQWNARSRSSLSDALQSWFFANDDAPLLASQTVQVRRVTKSHLVSAPYRSRRNRWTTPLCPKAPPVSQPDHIPSAKFLAEIARREKLPPLGYRARLEARAFIAKSIDSQRAGFEAVLGYSAAAARRKALAKRIEFAKALGNKPLPSKLIKKATVNKQRSRANAKQSIDHARRKIPSRTKNKRKLR